MLKVVGKGVVATGKQAAKPSMSGVVQIPSREIRACLAALLGWAGGEEVERQWPILHSMSKIYYK
jgi:hypothetical protein